MSLTYRLTLAGAPPLEDLAALIAPGATRTRTRSGNPRYTANFHDELGYTIDITAGHDGYYDAEDDDTHWVWEPTRYVDIDFDMNKTNRPETASRTMLAAVHQVLTHTTEDAALVLDGNWLLLTRTAGLLRAHNLPQWPDDHHTILGN